MSFLSHCIPLSISSLHGSFFSSDPAATVIYTLSYTTLFRSEVDQRQLVAITGGRGRGRRTRGRCALTFSRQPHLGLSRRADLTVSLKPIRLLPRLNSLHRANANLPINVGTDNLLHGGMIKVALRLETVTRRHIHEMPVLAIPPTLGPVPAIRLALALHPFLDRAMVDVDSEAVAVIRQAGSRGVRAAGLVRPPHTLKDAVRRLRLTFRASLRVVLLGHRHLVIVSPVVGPHLEVLASISYRTRHSARKVVRCVATQVLHLSLIGPSSGQCFKRRLSKLAVRRHGSSLKMFTGTMRGPQHKLLRAPLVC